MAPPAPKMSDANLAIKHGSCKLVWIIIMNARRDSDIIPCRPEVIPHRVQIKYIS